MFQGKIFIRLLAVLCAFTLIATACGDDDDGGASGGEGAGGEFSTGIVEPTFIDSFQVQDSEGIEVARLLYDSLTDFNEDLEVVGSAAESWTVSDDGTVYTFTLRSAKFHNGEDVTAQSFIDGWTFFSTSESVLTYYGGIAGISGWGEPTISGLKAVDDKTLEVTLDAANSLLPLIVAHPAFSPRPQAAIDDPTANLETPIGNGPYMMDGAWDHNVSIRVKRFEDYSATGGKADAINFTILDSIETQYLEVQAGNLDISSVPPEQLASAPGAFGDRYSSVEEGAYNYLGFSTQTAPWDNADIRVAMSMAIDRDTITQTIFSGARTPADGFYPPLAPGGTAGICTNCTYDPEKAKQMFDAAGGLPSGTITMYANSGGGHEDWLEAVANEWTRVFELDDVQFVFEDFSEYIPRLQAGDTEGPWRLGWGWDYPHAMAFIQPLFQSESGDNLSLYNGPDVDAAIADFFAQEDPEGDAARAAVVAASEGLNRDMPVIPLWFNSTQTVHTENVGNVVYSVNGYLLLENVTVNGG